MYYRIAVPTHAAESLAMPTDRDEILDAALGLPEADRLLIASRLLETLPDDLPGLSEDDRGFLDELERRAQGTDATVPLPELFKQD
jgi:hypothetical protein